MSKIKLTGESSGYVEISAGNAAGNNTLEAPTSGTRLVAHEGSQDVTLNGNLTVNGVISYEDTTNIDSVGVVTARNGLHVTGGNFGVGTNNPTAKVDIKPGYGTGYTGTFTGFDSFTPTTGEIRIGDIQGANASAGDYVGLRFSITGNNSGNAQAGIFAVREQAEGDGKTSLAFATRNWGNNFDLTEKLRITSAGIGINTASPRAVLDIEGNAENATLMLHSNDTNANLQFSDNTGGARILNYGGDLAFRTGTNAHVFGTGDSEALRITSSGDVIVGDFTPIDTRNTGGIHIQANNGVSFKSFTNAASRNWRIRNDDYGWGNLDFSVGDSVSDWGDSADDVVLSLSNSRKIGINQVSPFAELDITSTTETTTGTLSQHGIRLSAPGAADGEVIPITGGFLSNQDRARAGIGFISRVAGSSVGYAGAIGFYTRSSADGTGLLRTDEKVRINESGTLIVDAGGEAQDIQIISHSAGGGHGKVYLRGNASNESSSIQLNHFGHADYHISAGRAANGLFSITRTNGGSDGIVMNANGNVGIKNTGTSAKLHIGDLVSDITNDINTTHTSLIIKQTNNDNKSGIYIERSGERKGYSIWLNPGGGAGDALTFTRNNAGTKSDALILDRDANLTAGGHIYPASNNTYDLGSTANAWRNVYTNDLHLSNMSGGGNDVDGTTGDWTIQEGEENLYIINNRSGKKYKFNLQEVN